MGTQRCMEAQLASVSHGSHARWAALAKALQVLPWVQTPVEQVTSALPAVHSTQAPLEESQAAAPTRPAQSASPPHATQAWSVHTGVELGQSVFTLHATQALAPRSHTGVSPVHADVLSAVQATQVWLDESQATRSRVQS